MNDSFLSIVSHRTKPDTLLVRSRIAGDIDRAIPNAVVYEDVSADYRFRSDVPLEAVQAALSEALGKVNYDNFKASVKDGKRHSAYMSVWSALANAFRSG